MRLLIGPLWRSGRPLLPAWTFRQRTLEVAEAKSEVGYSCEDVASATLPAKGIRIYTLLLGKDLFMLV